jgi:hydrogenase-4 transcriptional activator
MLAPGDGEGAMDRKRVEGVLLQVWKESCRHIELTESFPEIAKTLRAIIPFERVQLCLVDGNAMCLQTVVAVPAESGRGAKLSLTAVEREQVRRWCRSERVLQRGKRLTGVLGLLLDDIPVGDVLAAPLHGEQVDAALVFFAARGVTYDGECLDLLSRLREPLSVAVGNHHRFHEMASLREAAEAEKGALLRRLGRTDLGDQIIGEHAGLQSVMQRVKLVANSDAPVLILGETGSGKEVIARALHNRGARHSGPFIRVNCGAIPPELIDSQLFGHERGAFTGAEQTRQGWFERAHGGTLFLDEIGELPLDAQVRFLRVLQDGFVERVGGDTPTQVDVRVVAATHRDLAGMVAAGKFREDLWYRVAVFPILLPPLRERRHDIPELAHHFAERAAVRFGLAPVQPSVEDIQLLQEYQWPGNIRELGAVIDRAAILGDGKSLEVAAALGLNRVPGHAPPSHPSISTVAGGPGSNVPAAGIDSGGDLSLDEAMRRHIERVLVIVRGKIEGPNGAARLLGINPHTLRARMRKLNVRWAAFRQ